MIGKLEGTVCEINQNYILLKPEGGVYYKIFLPAIVLKNIVLEQKASLYIYFHVRENEISLYGFPDKKYEQIFHILLSIPSVGPKSALNIIGFNELEKLIEAVHEQNSHYFSQIPGIGKKTAQKILLELSNKFAVEFKPQTKALTEDDKLVVEALISLGFKKHEAVNALDKLEKEQSLENKITQAIKNLNPNAKSE